jgi:hypothetical protein
VEYAIKMQKLEDRYFMLRLLKKGQIGTPEIRRLVSNRSRLHKKLVPHK